ncbi:proteoglycan 4b isoform X1 [Thunnus albacares]|uniref:proteoglycan 4b isoform X1 n=1 Tax=Thunnus albacares TaxID=8236 RepID=UPI001CF64011|nr:proteoglycan 4b isoform X1 [Thunnus albacares]
MSSTVLCSVVFLACALTLSAAQTSCKGRCGAEYYRGYTCQCDYTCLSYGECCKDYESKCTTTNSCKGRCGETFKRGRLCNCDPDCFKYNQCCSDFKTHCDAEEEINGAANVAAPCNNVKDNKPKEPTLNEATEDPLSTGDNTDDDLIPQANPSSSPQDDPSDDISSQILPNDEFSNNGPEDSKASPTPESTSDNGSPPADLLDQIITEPTLHKDNPELSTETVTVLSQTQTTPSDNEPTKADTDSPNESTDVSDPEMSTTSLDSGTTLSPSSTAVQQVSSQPASTSVHETEPNPTANTPELETEELAQNADPTEASTTTSSPPVASVSTELTKDSSTASEDSQVTTTSASTTLDPTPIPEATTSNTEPDVTEHNSDDVTTGPSSSLPDVQDPSTGVSPAAELDSLTTHAPSLTDAAKSDTTDDVTTGETTADPPIVTPEPTKPQPSEATSKPQVKPDPHKPLPTKPTSKPETKPLDTLNTDNPRDYQADDSNDTNLCSGRPVGAVTTLKNGTVVVFRGHYFWSLDRNKVPGPARGITQVWGVPSPIDTSFTRCNCQGKTYIFKGPQYWRYENDVLDPGYPKAIQTGFDGLRGHITAALSVPQYRRRREAVYFFKRGGSVQKYSYQFGTSPTCGRKVQHITVHAVRNRLARQAVSLLGPTISIQQSWKGFPSTITAAVSVPSTREPEGYKYVVFSRSKSYNVRIDGERPVVAPPKANTSPQSNEVFKCPKKV